MGHSLSADLVYGVIIGHSDDGWNFDGWPDPNEKLDLDEEETDGEWLEVALLMFLGHENPLDMGYPESNAAFKACPLAIMHGGFEYGRYLLAVRSSSVDGLYSVQHIDLPEPPSAEDAKVLVDFLKWLQEKGLVLEEKFRNPGWILAANYG